MLCARVLDAAAFQLGGSVGELVVAVASEADDSYVYSRFGKCLGSRSHTVCAVMGLWRWLADVLGSGTLSSRPLAPWRGASGR